LGPNYHHGVIENLNMPNVEIEEIDIPIQHGRIGGAFPINSNAAASVEMGKKLSFGVQVGY